MKKSVYFQICLIVLVVSNSSYSRGMIKNRVKPPVKNANTSPIAPIGKGKETVGKVEEETDASPFTGTFDIATNYVFRGLSNSNNSPAFQGGYSFSFLQTGIYVSLWGSNVDFPGTEDTMATVEVDPTIGITNTIGEDFSYNLSYNRYVYPKALGSDYNEAIAFLSYKFITGTLGYSPNVFDSGATGVYYNLGFNVTVPPAIFYFEDVSLTGGVGYYQLPEAAGLSYQDYNVALSKAYKAFTFALQWTDTNHHYYDNHLDGTHIIAIVTATF